MVKIHKAKDSGCMSMSYPSPLETNHLFHKDKSAPISSFIYLALFAATMLLLTVMLSLNSSYPSIMTTYSSWAKPSSEWNRRPAIGPGRNLIIWRTEPELSSGQPLIWRTWPSQPLLIFAMREYIRHYGIADKRRFQHKSDFLIYIKSICQQRTNR